MIAFKYIYIICKNIKINNNRDNNIKKYFHYIYNYLKKKRDIINIINIMSEYPYVSILTPTYKRKQFIELCILNLKFDFKIN